MTNALYDEIDRLKEENEKLKSELLETIKEWQTVRNNLDESGFRLFEENEKLNRDLEVIDKYLNYHFAMSGPIQILWGIRDAQKRDLTNFKQVVSPSVKGVIL